MESFSNCHIDLVLLLHLDLLQLTVTVAWPRRLWFSFQLSYLRVVRPKRAQPQPKSMWNAETVAKATATAKAKAKANLRLVLMKYRQEPDKSPPIVPDTSFLTWALIPDWACHPLISQTSFAQSNKKTKRATIFGQANIYVTANCTRSDNIYGIIAA